MARRKRAFLDDSDPDSSEASGDDGADGFRPDDEDQDTRAERELFEDPYHRKKRRTVAEDEDDEDEGFGAKRGGLGSKPRMNLNKLPTFVSGETTKMDIEKELEDAEDDVEEDDDDDEVPGELSSGEGDSETSKPPSSRVRYGEEEEEEASRPTGMSGFATSARSSGNTGAGPSADSKPSARGGLGSSSRSSIGSSSSQATPGTDLPTAFGGESTGRRPQRSFLRKADSEVRPAAPLSAQEAMHFSKLQGTFGAKMMAKMGWQVGTGLGASGEGIVNPIESKLRPARAGIAAGGFKEKTAQSIAEAKRRGEHVSDEEDIPAPRRKGAKAAKAKAAEAREIREQWKQPRKKKTVVQHRTYEEIMQDAGQDTAGTGVGVIIDATGATPREVTSLTELSASPWGATNDPTRLPELRHNLRLIVDLAKGELDGLAREAKALQERKKWIHDEEVRLRKVVSEEATLIERLQKVHIIVGEIKVTAQEVGSLNGPTLEPFIAGVETLCQTYEPEYEKYRLDEIVVAAIAPPLRRLLLEWVPLQDPIFVAPTLRKWRKALRMSAVKQNEDQLEVYGVKNLSLTQKQPETSMTPYEGLLWNAWLPKVRSCINNDWSPTHPQPLIQLLEAWSDILPQFISDNILDQLIIPKVQKAISEWNPKKGDVSLHSLLFPWLPHVGLRLEQVVGDARRKVKSLFRGWKTEDGVPEELMLWQNVFDVSDWQNMLLKYVVPKLGATLRDEFKINPRKQDMEPLQRVFLWAKHLKASIFQQLLETEFFPKWLGILHVWLIQPSVNFDEVTDWYKYWKDSFPEDVLAMPGIQHGFTAGLQLMHNAMDLGLNAPRLLKKPDFKPLSTITSSAPSTGKSRPGKPSVATEEVTFRAIVEEYAGQHNLLFIPTGKTHERSRLPIYKVSPHVDGKGGLAVYVQDEAVWAAAEGGGEDWRAIGLEEMVLRATKGKK
ncbi:hypothetical protein FRB94_006174 [Tulasnella sp. JGI-2019a]|nr:hypothetical protein FRB94_006174 [Tulasnella sp. JGI-2019a]